MQFYKETKFKKVELSGGVIEIPKDWEVVRLGDKEIAEIRKNKSISGIDEVAFISMELIPDSEIYVKFEIRKLEEVRSFTYCEAGDLLLAKITPCFENGKQGIVPDNVPNGFALATTEVFPIACKRIDRLFLFYVLKHPRFRKILEYSMRGTTGRKRVPKEAVENLIIPYPPLEEQKKIAEILSTVDRAIEKTDEMIAKTERLKKGLMQKLLTGVVRVRVEDGKISFYKEERFKDSEIGKIPEDWEVVRLEDACIKITDGSHWSPKEVENSNYLIATVANMREYYIDIKSCKRISKEDFERLLRDGDVPELGDVLFSKDGTVGICFTFKQANYNIAVLSSIAIIKPKKNVLYSDFCAYVLKSPKILQLITGRKTGTALRRIVLKDLKEVKIPLPPLQEQKAIANILLNLDKNLEILRKEKEKLERIKKGLMDVLLTGKVRVKV